MKFYLKIGASSRKPIRKTPSMFLMKVNLKPLAFFLIENSDIGDIIGVKLRLSYKPGILTRKPKWLVEWLSAEVCRKLLDDGEGQTFLTL